MKKAIITISIFFISISFFAQESNEKKIECIDLFFIEIDIHYSISINCNQLKMTNPHYLKIEDSLFFNEIKLEIIKLSKNEIDETVDTRISAEIYYEKSTSTDILCLSKNSGILLNFERMKHSKKLLELITTKIEFYDKKQH